MNYRVIVLINGARKQIPTTDYAIVGQGIVSAFNALELAGANNTITLNGQTVQSGGQTLIQFDGLNAQRLYIAGQAVGDVLAADSVTTFTRLAPGATGTALTSNGPGILPSWQSANNRVVWNSGDTWANVYAKADALRPVDIVIPDTAVNRQITAGAYNLAGIHIIGLRRNTQYKRPKVVVNDGATLGNVIHMRSLDVLFNCTTTPAITTVAGLDIYLHDTALINAIGATVSPILIPAGLSDLGIRMFEASKIDDENATTTPLIEMADGGSALNIFTLTGSYLGVLALSTAAGPATANLFVDDATQVSGLTVSGPVTTVYTYVSGAIRTDDANPPTVPINWNNQRIYSLADPVLAQDAATRSFVDTKSAKESVVAASTGLNVSPLSGLLSLDSIAVGAGERILLKDQANPVENGIWVVQAGVWSRPLDFAAFSNVSGTHVFVKKGLVNKSSGWICTAESPFATVGTHDLFFRPMAGQAWPSPTFYVDPGLGDDTNPGTNLRPLATLAEALRRLNNGWTGQAFVLLSSGTYTLGSNPELFFRAAVGKAEPLLIVGAMSDSGLGNCTVAASTAGSGSTFGTVQDTLGGWVVNAYRGMVLRFTTGAQAGRQYRIASNTANTLTLCGTLTVPANGDLFVIEFPSSILEWSGLMTVFGNGALVGWKNIEFRTANTSASSRFFNIQFQAHVVNFTNHAATGIILQNNTRFEQIGTTTTVFSSNTIALGVGYYFSGGVATSSVFVNTGCAFSVSRSLFINTGVDCQQGGFFVQILSSYITGGAYLRGQGGGGFVTLTTSRLETVTPAPALLGGVQGAAIALGNGTTALLSTCAINNTPATTAPGDAIYVIDGSHVDIGSMTGTGNAGIGMRIRRKTSVTDLTGNTVTGTADVKIGANATATWAAATNTTDLAAGVPELCGMWT